MKRKPWTCFAALSTLGFMTHTAFAQTESHALTIYNQNFAVVREIVPLDLKSGSNHLTFNDITAHVEPSSVVLRDPLGKRTLQILEQNYRADPLSQDLLLSLYEGKTIDFLVQKQDHTETVQGKIIRSGYVPHTNAYSQYGYGYQQQQYAYASSSQPIIEVNGKLQFTLPGQPLFPSLSDDTILKPTFDWTVNTDKSGPLNAELAYVTGGMSWSADYNLIAPENGDTLDLVGWVTMDNQSGKTFENAKIKLMAGDVNKIQPQNGPGGFGGALFAARSDASAAPTVTEKAFDEYHLYTLERPTTLRDRETKQVEFVRANGIAAKQIYVYDGVDIDFNRYSGWSYDNIRQNREYGSQSTTKVSVMREFVNSEANQLGKPLPKGRLRFYRRDADGQLEFTGENIIDHTPTNETVRVTTGNAFDLTGERTQTDFKSDYNNHILEETFSIKLHNHKKTPVEIRVVEHLYRGINWTLLTNSDPYDKKDAHTIEYHVKVLPEQEKVVTYTAHYTW